MRRCILLIAIVFCGCNPKDKISFDEINYTYDNGWKTAYSLKLFNSGLMLVGDGRWEKKFYSGEISHSALMKVDSLLNRVSFEGLDSVYENEIEDQASYKLIVYSKNNKERSIFAYGESAPAIMDSLSLFLRQLKNGTTLKSNDTFVVFKSLERFYPPAFKK